MVTLILIRELRRTLQERYARLMGLLEEQVTDIKVHLVYNIQFIFVLFLSSVFF